MFAKVTSVLAHADAVRPLWSMTKCPVCRVPVRPRIRDQRCRATSGVCGLPSPSPSSSSMESQPRTTSAAAGCARATARAFASARICTACGTGSGPFAWAALSRASSSTSATWMIGSIPAERRVAARAGEAEARSRVVTRPTLMQGRGRLGGGPEGGAMAEYRTTDLWDAFEEQLQSVDLDLRDYGGERVFAGSIRTVKCRRDRKSVV